ncbi:fructose 1,6-bisphosphate aldolase [Salmonella enterica subsp. enterica]|uniref:Fructose 1,6-bisphosphate aldolase n=1 Tax=Salmonella enterica I TaxID=59201 RepID=A0A379UVD0_SALET|nr:fructose 1,6-bisphosphate aldolase [Salmonella enterica subsp. enterica]
MSKIFDFVKPGVITGDDVRKCFQVAKENNFALPAVNCVALIPSTLFWKPLQKLKHRSSFSSPTAARPSSR